MTDPTQAAMETARVLARFVIGPRKCAHAHYCIDQTCQCANAIARALLLAKAEGMRETTDWLESNGQPGYAIKLRVRALELEQAAERIAP